MKFLVSFMLSFLEKGDAGLRRFSNSVRGAECFPGGLWFHGHHGVGHRRRGHIILLPLLFAPSASVLGDLGQGFSEKLIRVSLPCGPVAPFCFLILNPSVIIFEKSAIP